MDHYIGAVLDALKREGLDGNTIVIFTSDNGPWFKGSAGHFRGRKGQSYEGGYRVPFIVKWPGRVLENTSSNMVSTHMDVFPTLLEIANLGLPKDRLVDGKNVLPLWKGLAERSPHEHLFFYHFDEVEAVLAGDWKYLENTNHYVWPILLDREGLITHELARPWFGEQRPNLYNLALDEKECYDLSHHYGGVVDSLARIIRDWNVVMADNPGGWLGE